MAVSRWAQAAANRGVSAAQYARFHQPGGHKSYADRQNAAQHATQAAATPQGHYGGLGDIVDFLAKGGITQDQLNNMTLGNNGVNAAIGGAGGRFAGLSPYAMHFLATSGLLQAQAPELMSLKDQHGVDLTGDELFKAQLYNAQMANQPKTYKLHSGVDSGFLEKLLGTIGHPAFQTGYNATGFGSPTG